MKKISATIIITTLVAVSFVFSKSFAGDAEKEKCISLVDQAIAFYKLNGEKKLLEAINDKGMFKEGEMYVWVSRTDFKDMSMAIAHMSKALIGKNFIDLKDANGKSFIREINKVAAEKGKGWVDYMWTNPESKKIKPKHNYCVKVNNDLVFNCGYYDK